MSLDSDPVIFSFFTKLKLLYNNNIKVPNKDQGYL